jgi:hypothetical protein
MLAARRLAFCQEYKVTGQTKKESQWELNTPIGFLHR